MICFGVGFGFCFLVCFKANIALTGLKLVAVLLISSIAMSQPDIISLIVLFMNSEKESC